MQTMDYNRLVIARHEFPPRRRDSLFIADDSNGRFNEPLTSHRPLDRFRCGTKEMRSSKPPLSETSRNNASMDVRFAYYYQGMQQSRIFCFEAQRFCGVAIIWHVFLYTFGWRRCNEVVKCFWVIVERVVLHFWENSRFGEGYVLFLQDSGLIMEGVLDLKIPFLIRSLDVITGLRILCIDLMIFLF
ncbi:hypothetical protein WN55_10524 [Dufourea novaeangliae]|uniref:Uncharacterized protein n=1 Tax=Dufourea novaeangliae TaxID=178035 RepID=A0A154P448_DUFNO|nr:hypothetical protein WN55_10524 [Dufourea novaeangliae]